MDYTSVLAREDSCFLHDPAKQEKTKVKILYLVVIGRTAKKLNLYIRKLINENSLIAVFHI